jgi:hypothetical protein
MDEHEELEADTAETQVAAFVASLDPEVVATLSFRDRVALAAAVTEFTGAEQEHVDSYLGQPLDVVGAVETYYSGMNKESGKLLEGPVNLFLLEDGTVLRFMSRAAHQFHVDVLARLFGIGRWPGAVKIVVRQAAIPEGRTYRFQIVG